MRGQPNTYTARGAVSNVDDPLEYQFDWKGDGTDLSAWIAATSDPRNPLVKEATAQKIWTTSGTYTVRARARCSMHPTFVSNWSSGLVVVVEFVNPPVTPDWFHKRYGRGGLFLYHRRVLFGSSGILYNINSIGEMERLLSGYPSGRQASGRPGQTQERTPLEHMPGVESIPSSSLTGHLCLL